MKTSLYWGPVIWACMGLVSCISADGQFVSRPDLSPPRLNITIPATEDVGDGYIFVCPYGGFKSGTGFDGPEQPACYIFRDDGDLVWSSLGHLSGWVANIQARSFRGKPAITVYQGAIDEFRGHGWGQATILNERYENVATIRAGNHKIMSIHEFNLLESNSALVEIYQPTPIDLTRFNGKKGAKWIVDAMFQEIDVDTGDVLFEWSSLDHVSPTESVISLSSGYAGGGLNSTDAWDYFHLNSVEKDHHGDYLISGRHTSTVYKIDGKTGEIIWRLGGRNSNFSVPSETAFGFQHDARYLADQPSDAHIHYISLFDNAARSKGHQGNDTDSVHERSSAKILRLDTKTWQASVVKSVSSPDGLLALSQGNAQTLSNSNIFVGWGQAGAVTEFRERDDKPIFHAYLDSGDIGYGVQSYRAFRFPWKGYPQETPAIVALLDESHSGGTSVHISWNGDTETATWKVYATSPSCTSSSWKWWSCQARLLQEAKRAGFETVVHVADEAVASGLSTVYAEAFNAEGHRLVKTAAVTASRRLRTYNSHSAQEQQIMVMDELR
ncbi:hypothetical protein LMH87_004988 [Akanthomyces muscarius]|uniref:Arylsulfotransferase n=1 Tax=Akanthomyces muscarius TaxID=2231603 RepID=A0A9W8QN93_AKAMU|nr:hypothetical protein LMH87_004988 [Akanthomyces muscarius]KAJ4163247.1 hypothetical protein LMH87_004988 [Akanthomyces muscarius]